jgi:hypothetical protein
MKSKNTKLTVFLSIVLISLIMCAFVLTVQAGSREVDIVPVDPADIEIIYEVGPNGEMLRGFKLPSPFLYGEGTEIDDGVYSSV